MLFGIKTVIAEGIEIFFVDMNDQPSDKLKGRNGFILTLFIFMAIVPKRDLLSIVIGNARLSHGRSADISGYVISDSFGRVKIGFRSMDIETVLVVGIHGIF